MDEDGFLYFVGRRDTIIKSSGYRISPTEVEEVLMKSGLLQETAVVGLPDEALGQTVKAFVVPRVDTFLDLSELTAFCTAHLPRYMVPRQIESLNALPKTTSGKINYPALQQLGEALQ